MKFDEHPTVVKVREQSRDTQAGSQPVNEPLDADWLKSLALECGADDAGLVEIDRPALAGEKAEIRQVFPQARVLLSFVCRMNREAIRSPARSIANLEFHHTGDHVNDVARRIVSRLESKGVRAVNPAMGFPMEMDRFPGRLWVVSHKPVAVEAGLGVMGIHRNVIHPKFGNFILLGTILIDAAVTATDSPICFNPCLECKLCVAACPVGAISADGHFDFSACYTHNYREFMGGFTEWVERLADSDNRFEYRDRVNDSESASMWQSLSFGANYKAAYCLAVCPAGEDVISPFLNHRSQHLQDYVKPLQDKAEPVYVIKNSDAQDHVRKRFPHKSIRTVTSSLRPKNLQGFVEGLPLVFQREKSAGSDRTYHFRFYGSESREITVVIRNRTVSVAEGLAGRADLRVTARAETWLGFLRGENSLFWALLTGRLRLKGSPLRLLEFGRCFPA